MLDTDAAQMLTGTKINYAQIQGAQLDNEQERLAQSLEKSASLSNEKQRDMGGYEK